MRSITLGLNGKAVTIYGGPYRERPEATTDNKGAVCKMFGVKMAEEIDQHCDIDIPTADFSTPEPKVFFRGLLQGATLLLDGKKMYVGCMGGIGRTGLYLTAMQLVSAKQARLGTITPTQATDEAIETVRALFNKHAVETQGQVMFLQEFNTSKAASIISKGIWYIKSYLWVTSIFDKLKLTK